MATKTCFVIMAIGGQKSADRAVSAEELKASYDNLIKEAILKAKPNLEVVRADEVALPGTITTDIITRLMHSDYVVADVSYPNPNVFYELGLRHACRTGTIIIKDRQSPKSPFDIAHLRHIEYENTTSGLKDLSNQLGVVFDHFDKDPTRPDNHFLELAKLTSFVFPNYSEEDEVGPEIQIMMSVMQSPEIMNLIMKQQAGEQVDQAEMLRLLSQNPEVAQPLLQALFKSGSIALPRTIPRKPPQRKKTRR